MEPALPTDRPRLRIRRSRPLLSGGRNLAGAASLSLDVAAPLTYASPPRDVFLLGVLCDDGLSCQAAGETRTEATLSTLRTSSALLDVQGRGDLALALIEPAGSALE